MYLRGIVRNSAEMPARSIAFSVVAKILALTIQQNREFSGITVPGEGDKENKISAFVDDSTVFLQKAQHLPRVMTTVKQIWVVVRPAGAADK